MANKRLSKLKTSELEPSEQGLADDDGHEFNLSGVLSLGNEENMSLHSDEKGKLWVIYLLLL